MSDYERGDTEAVNDFIHKLHFGNIKLTAKDAQALSTAQHAATVNLPEFDFVSIGFERLADDWFQAIKCYERDEENASEPEKPQRRSELERAFEFGAAFVALDGLQIRGNV